MQIDRIKYTMKHRKAFRAVEKHLLGHNTIRVKSKFYSEISAIYGILR